MRLAEVFNLKETRTFKQKLILTFLFLAAFNIGIWVGAGIALSKYNLVGEAVLAYSLGLRHALDADHITAIDNVTRKLIQSGKRPCLVGFFFSIGHSTIVVCASIAVAATATAIASKFPSFENIGGIIGTVVSGTFCVLIGIMNAVVLYGVWKQLKMLRTKKVYREVDVEEMLNSGGYLTRLLKRVFAFIDASWKMYPLGVLFGLGFDTATEVTLLALSATQANKGLPMAYILFFPFLFTAGMALIDTIDGVLMLCTYTWAYISPIRKIYFNFTITLISVVIALLIGLVELFGIVGDQLNLQGGFWRFFDTINNNFDIIGPCIVGLFAVTWIVAVIVYKFSGFVELEKDIVIIRGDEDIAVIEKDAEGKAEEIAEVKSF
ncbi:hydrogenase nickel incorporation protein hupN [Basidiobolus meristosporus CBS 931.73]|uniref:Nickel/cobalt efflux system n=1 Tax=Basidiobolus meristosporus CBS 931.73 TaxID=1314790 RepID=A0A1Y1XXC0_9FUNG|nr:hydrogenase nickel incorporation protein hupN [Basidiobolus meristosporus CBS 931.73]|eukprot:ORX90401.1 hydrogenase nickel incorporation protein hupN [Basidiobolus meristosporus CBS 931.73]